MNKYKIVTADGGIEVIICDRFSEISDSFGNTNFYFNIITEDGGRETISFFRNPSSIVKLEDISFDECCDGTNVEIKAPLNSQAISSKTYCRRDISPISTCAMYGVKSGEKLAFKINQIFKLTDVDIDLIVQRETPFTFEEAEQYLISSGGNISDFLHNPTKVYEFLKKLNHEL